MANALKFMYESHNKHIIHEVAEAMRVRGYATPGLQNTGTVTCCLQQQLSVFIGNAVAKQLLS